MRRAAITFPTVIFTAALAAFAFGNEPSTSDTAGSRAVFPPPVRTGVPAHEQCPEAQKSCLTCHPEAQTSRWSSDRLVPEMNACAACHPVTASAGVLSPLEASCRGCHRQISTERKPVRGNYRRPNLRFSHKAHTKVACAECHPRSAAGTPLKGALDTVGMRRCFRCHGDSKCRTCHLTDKDGRMRTNLAGQKLYPPAWLRGKSHGTEWVGTHAASAGADSEFCAACHTEAFCRDCHSGARRPRNVHPGDWLTSHGVSTRLDNPRCRGCHRAQSFCITCHRRIGVAPDSAPRARPSDAGAYHKGMKTRDLMRRAKQNIVGCVACHTESSCITCHIRYNPHPPDFARRCKPLAARNRRACAKCHTDDVYRFCR